MTEIRSAQPARSRPQTLPPRSPVTEALLGEVKQTGQLPVDKPSVKGVTDMTNERRVLNTLIEALGSLATADRKRILDSALKFLGD